MLILEETVHGTRYSIIWVHRIVTSSNELEPIACRFSSNQRQGQHGYHITSSALRGDLKPWKGVLLGRDGVRISKELECRAYQLRLRSKAT